MFALLILPILVSGFIALSYQPENKLKIHRYNGQFLYFKAASYGSCYFLVSMALAVVLKNQTFSFELPVAFSSNYYFAFLKTYSASNSTKILFEPSIATTIATFIQNAENKDKISSDILEVSWLLLISIATIFVSCVHTLFSCYLIKIKGFISNKIFNKNNDLVKISMMVNLFKDSPFDNILLSSFIQKKPLLFTLKSRKVYIGVVISLGEPNEDNAPNQEITILPVASGYRDKDSLQVKLTNDYNGYENIDSSISMEIVIDVSVIETVSWFDFGAYESVNNSLISTDTDSADDIENDKSPDEITILSIGKFSLKRRNIF